MARRFSAQLSTIIKDLTKVMTAMNATTLQIANRNLLDDTDVKATITFDYNGIRYVSSCDFWDYYLDNLRAAQQAVTWTYNIAVGYGVEYMEGKYIDDTLRRIFGTLEASPDSDTLLIGDGNSQWFEILDVDPNANKIAIVNAYKALARVHHPDVGGDKNDFIKLKNAYDEGIAQL